jgi:tetratricopeptide (TPR) repeat protein
MLWALLAAAALPALLALVGLRYRMPLVPLLALFSGRGAAALFESVRGKDLRRAARLAAVAAAVFGASRLRTHPPTRNFAEELALGGNSLIQLNRPAEAAASYRRAAEADPSLALAWEGLGRVELKAGRIGEAEGLRSRVDPSLPEGYYHLGLAAEMLGEAARPSLLPAGPRHLTAISRSLEPRALLARQGRADQAAEFRAGALPRS